MMPLSFFLFLSCIFTKPMNPQPHYCLLPFDDINQQDTSYDLRPHFDTRQDMNLQKSIKKFGFLQPPLLQRINEHYIILSGRKRVQVAESLAWKEIPCLVIGENADLYKIFEMILVHALIGSRLSPIEQAILFSKIGDSLSKKQTVTLLPLLGIKPYPYKLQELTTNLQLDPTAIEALHTGLIQQKTVNKLSKLSKGDQKTVIELIAYFKFGGSKQQKLVNYALELVMRTTLPFEDFVLKWKQEENKYDNRPQQASALLNSLETQCFPNKKTAEEQFQQFTRSVQLPENFTLHHTTSFEDDRLTLSIVFDNQAVFLKGWKEIKKNL